MNQLKIIGVALVMVTANAYAHEDSVHSWAGTYLGAHAGAGSGKINQSFSDTSQYMQQLLTTPFTTTATQGAGSGFRDGNSTGSNIDLLVGYTIHPNESKLMVGGQFEGTLFNNLTMKASGTRYGTIQTVTVANNITTRTRANTTSISEMSIDLQSMVSLVGRAGFFAKSNTLLYGLLGATEGNFLTVEYPVAGGLSSNNISTTGSGTASILVPNPNSTGNQRSQWNLGMTTGGGVEYKLTEHWSILGEYRYLRFDFNQIGSLASKSNTTTQGTQVQTSVDNRASSQNTHSTLNFNLGQVGIIYRI